MQDPPRLGDEERPKVQLTLLKAGMSYCDSEATRDKPQAALRLRIGGQASGYVPWPVAKRGWVSVALTTLVVGLLVASLAGYLMARWRPHLSDAEQRPAPAASIATPSAAEAPLAVTEPPTEPAWADVPSEGSNPRRILHVDHAPTLGAELAALDAVRLTLDSRNATGAHTLLKAYFRTFPRGRLHVEAEALEVDALAQSGSLRLAKQRAHAFLDRHPGSALTPRVAAVLRQQE